MEFEELQFPSFIMDNMNWLSAGAYAMCLGFLICVYALKQHYPVNHLLASHLAAQRSHW